MYGKILQAISITASVVILLGGIVLFNDLGVNELVKSKVNGLMNNKSTLESQKTTLLNKVDELSGNIETLLSQKELLLGEIKKLEINGNVNKEEIVKLEKLVEQLKLNINLLVDEKEDLKKKINTLEENKVLLQEDLEKQRAETEKANTYIKEMYDYINTINVEEIPELEPLPEYEINSLEEQLPSDNELVGSDIVWDTRLNNPNFIAFAYENLAFQITEKDNNKVVWFFNDRDTKDDIDVVFEYTGVDNQIHTNKLEHATYNILDVEPKKYNKIIINYSDGSRKVIGIIN